MQELLRVQNESLSNADFHIDRRFQVDMEWWVLGKAVECLAQAGDKTPVFAVKANHVDFMTFDRNGVPFCPIEITEALEPGRQRAKEYQDAKQMSIGAKPEGKLIETIAYPWKTLRKVLSNKYQKSYPSCTWLIVYFNISYSKISEFGWWHSTLIANASNWNLATSPFARVLILNAGGDALVQISPQLAVVKEESQF